MILSNELILTPIDPMFNTASAISSWNKLQQNIKLTEAETKSFNAAMKSSAFDDYIDSIKDGSASFSGYIKYLFTARQETLALSIAQKTATVVVNALKMALNMAIVFAVSEGIAKLVEYVSNLKTATQQAKEELDTATQNLNDTNDKINDINTKLQDTNKQIDVLKSKGSLTFVEKSQFQTLQQTSAELQTQLGIQQALQKIQQEKKTNAAIKTINAQSEEKISPFTGTVNTDNYTNPKSGIDGINDALSFYSARIKQVNKDQEEYNTLLAKGNNLTDEEKRKKETLAYILKDDDSTTLKENLLNRAKAYQDEANAIDVDSTTNKQAAQAAKKTAEDQANAIFKVVDAEQYAETQTNKFNSVWKNDENENVVRSLSDLASQGKITAKTFNDPAYTNIKKEFENAGISAQDAAEQINALNQKTTENNNIAEDAATANAKLAKSLQSLASSNVANYQSLQGILDNVKDYKTLSSDNLNTLLKIFPDTASSVLEYNTGLKSTASMVDLIKQKMQSLQNSYADVVKEQLENDAAFYSSTISKHGDLIAQLSNLYGIDYKNYTTYQQLKDAVNQAVLSTEIGNSNITGQQLANQYLANVQNYSDYEEQRPKIVSAIESSIQNLNVNQLAKLATVYGIDVKNYGNTQSGKIIVAGEIADRIAAIYGATDDVIGRSLSNELQALKNEYNVFLNSVPANGGMTASDKSYLSDIQSRISSLQNAIKATSGGTSDLQGKIDNIVNSVKITIPPTTSALKSTAAGVKKAGQDAAKASKDAAKAAKDAASALKEQYEAELKVIETNNEEGKYKEKIDYYHALVQLQQKWAKTQLDSDDKQALALKVYEAHKDYEQANLDASYAELNNRISLGKVQEGSIQQIQNLLEIQKNLNSAGMSLVNTKENQLELDKKIYDAEKQYQENVLSISKAEMQNRIDIGAVVEGSEAVLQNLQEIYKNLTKNPNMSIVNTEENRLDLEKQIYSTKKSILESEISELDNEVNLGKIQEGTLEYLQRLQTIKSNINKSDLGTADKATELESINEKIYSANTSYNESQINEIDHLVSIGKLQENSLEYIQRLNSLYRSLNLTLEQRESLQEKIFSAEKDYISQLESDLTDESIEGSYGAQIKAIQDKIDAIDKENDATSKQIALEKAQAALEEARNQKTISIFRENHGFVYEADQSSVIEKQQAVADAKRDEEIEKLTEQKDKIQSEADDMKSQLEDVLHDLDGSNEKTWNDIQDEIDDVIENVDKVFKTHTSKTKSYYNDIDTALDESTENTENDYQLQLDSAQNYFDEIQELQPKIVAQNNKIANSFQHIADALYNMNGQYDRMGRAIRYAEEDREQANIDYNEFNKSMKEDHQTIKYASGTQYSVGGLAKTDEEGYELKLQNMGDGKYTLLNEGSMVLTAADTKNLYNLAHNTQADLLKSGLQNKINIPNITNRNSETNHNNYHIDKVEFPNVTDRDEIKQAFTELPTYFLQKSYSNK